MHHTYGRHLDLERVAAWPSPRASSSYPVGCLECVDFRTAPSLATMTDNEDYLEQCRSTRFEWTGTERGDVNAIALFIWVGFVGATAPAAAPTRAGPALRSASPATAFPYGCGATVDVDVQSVASSFSSCSSDNKCSSSWRNLVLVLPNPMVGHASQAIRVDTVARIGRTRAGQPAPVYAFTVRYEGAVEVHAKFVLDMDVLYPKYCQLPR